MKTTLIKSLAAATMVISGIMPAQASLFTFDSNPGWSDGLQASGYNASVWYHSVDGGIGNSGWLRTQNPSGGGNSIQEAYILSDSFAVAPEKITLGVYFYWDGEYSNGSTGDHYLIRLGIGRSNGTTDFIPRFSSTSTALASADQQLDIGLVATGNPNVVRVRGSRMINGLNGPALNTPVKEATLAQETWYYMEVSYTLNLTGTSYDIALALYESDGNGNTIGSSLLDWSATPDMAGLLTGNLQGFFASRQSKFTNVVGIDNFSAQAIPEAGATALLGAGATLLLLGRAAFKGSK